MALPRAYRKTRNQRGLTLVELLIVIALIAVLGGTVLMGPGMLEGSRLKSAATLIVSGVRLGLARAVQRFMDRRAGECALVAVRRRAGQVLAARALG